MNLFLAAPCLQFPALICIIPSSDPETGGKRLFQAAATSPFSCFSFPGHIPPSFRAESFVTLQKLRWWVPPAEHPQG